MSNGNEESVPIPVIDISNADLKTGYELIDAAAGHGFVFIRSHGMDFTLGS
jgi:hypothetical protein